MAATFGQIENWFDRGVEQGARWMLVVCDSFDHTDYPEFFSIDEQQACVDRIENIFGGREPMQRLMEVYDLKLNKAYQLKEFRAQHFPTSSADGITVCPNCSSTECSVELVLDVSKAVFCELCNRQGPQYSIDTPNETVITGWNLECVG